MRRTLTSAALAVSLALTLGACGDDPEPTSAESGTAVASASPSAPAEITPAAFVTSISDALAASGSYAFTVSTTTQGATLVGSGRFVGASPTETAMSMTTSMGDSVSVDMILVDGHLYMDGSFAGAEGTWIDLNDATDESLSGLADEISKSADPSQLVSNVSGDAIRRGESSTIDGVAVTEYTMTMDLTEAAGSMGEGFTADQLAVLEASGATGMDIVYFLDAEDRPVKVTATMGDVMSMEMSYSGFGAQEPVTAPAPESVVLASQFGL